MNNDKLDDYKNNQYVTYSAMSGEWFVIWNNKAESYWDTMQEAYNRLKFLKA